MEKNLSYELFDSKLPYNYIEETVFSVLQFNLNSRTLDFQEAKFIKKSHLIKWKKKQKNNFPPILTEIKLFYSKI